MYVPPHFAETRPEQLQALMRAHPLATVVAATADGLDANHLPLLLAAAAGPLGTLYGHVARANPVCRLPQDSQVLAIFTGPDHYISPNWYPSKQENGRVVPTWNYVAVHAHGRLRTVDDPAWLRANLDALTAQQEAAQAAPWSIADAPPEFIERLLGTIVGIEIEITQLVGKWKVSQNQPEQNRQGVASGLAATTCPAAAAMATLVSERGIDNR